MAGIKHSGIIDEEKAKWLATRDQIEKQRLKAENWLQTQSEQHLYVKDGEETPFAIKSHQWGVPMDYTELERRLKLLSIGDKLVFADTTNRPFRGVMMPKEHSLKTISCYGRTLLPEFSVIKIKENIVRDFSFRHISYLDMPPLEFRGLKEGFKPKDPNALKPGWKIQYESQGEDPHDPQARGWRKVAMEFVLKGLATPSEIERLFGRSDRASWATGMGKRRIALPY